jgi:hypothetical protein
MDTRAIELESLQFKNKEPEANIQREDAWVKQRF